MNDFNLVLGLLVVVFFWVVLHKLAVRRAKYLVELELQSDAPNPFADVILGPEPTPTFAPPEDVSPQEDVLPPRRGYVSNSKPHNTPAFVANRQQHATSS